MYHVQTKALLTSSHKRYLKEIVGQVFEIYAIELLGSLPTDEACRHLRYITIFTSPPIGGGRGIVMPMSVCLSVCLCVCLSVFSQNFNV